METAGLDGISARGPAGSGICFDTFYACQAKEKKIQ